MQLYFIFISCLQNENQIDILYSTNFKDSFIKKSNMFALLI